MTDDFWDGPSGFQALLYLPRSASGDTPAFPEAEAEIRHRARKRGLRLPRRAVHDPQEVDGLLDRYPGAAVLVRPSLDGGALRERLMERDQDLLEGLLALGATLRLCDEGAEATWPDRDDWTGGRPVLLLSDPFAPVDPLRLASREKACRRYALHLAPYRGEAVHDLATYERFVDRELGAVPLDPGATVVIHKEAFATDTGGRSPVRDRLWRRVAGPDLPHRSPVRRWLERGAVIHSTGRVRHPEPRRGAPRPGEADAQELRRAPERMEQLEHEDRMRRQREHRERVLEKVQRLEDLESEPPLGYPQRPPAQSAPQPRYDRARESTGPASSGDDDLDVPDFLRNDSGGRDLPTSPRPARRGSSDSGEDRSYDAYVWGGQANTGLVYQSARSITRRASVPPTGTGPGRDPGQPLPHDGLFIRRSTAYGTRSQLGITELIENGVLIGQDQIRFDDFVASRTDQVPGPPAGEAVSVSHGIAAVPGDSKAREATTHFVEIALKAAAGPTKEAPPQEPLPVNLVFVVDTSYSMAGSKLDTVKSALQQIYRRLRPTDCLGIVTFATDVATLLPATRKADLPEVRFAQLVSGMTASGGTDINLGVQYGIAEIGRRASTARTVNRLYLFSDGDPTSGERNWTVIRRNLAARLRGDLTLSCFGFGADARMTELSALAGTAGGSSAFVTRPEDVGTGLLEDLERRDHLAAIDVQLRIDVDPEVEVWHLYGHDLVSDPRERTRVFREAAEAARTARERYGTEVLPDLITGEKGIRIFAPDLAFGETYWVVLEVRVPEGREPSDGLGTATVQYADTLARQSRSRELALAEGTSLDEETVIVHAVGLRTSEVTYRALDDLYDNDREAAGRRLDQHIEVLQETHRSVPVEELVDDRVVLQKLRTLAEGLGTAVAYTDGAAPAPGIRVMNHFAKMRSGAFSF
ncbi:VWA domain-containing protein [Streptomyces sp. NPDC048603]|uniref:VWA domain-containing protein n=1 Tax=Streptomyces sp. NPDC048603 TaxID=3365577 RepID=UPI00371F7FE3